MEEEEEEEEEEQEQQQQEEEEEEEEEQQQAGAAAAAAASGASGGGAGLGTSCSRVLEAVGSFSRFTFEMQITPCMLPASSRISDRSFSTPVSALPACSRTAAKGSERR